MRLRRFLLAACVAALPLVAAQPVQARGIIGLGMTAADIPLTNGQPEQGFAGNRLSGLPLFGSLTMRDLSSADRPSGIIRGLATEWRVDPNDRRCWIFALRRGVRLHDGSAFNPDAVVWNVRKLPDRQAPHVDPRQMGVTATRMPTLCSAAKIDDHTVALVTARLDSLLPIPEAHARTAALLTNQMDWIEAPAPNAIPPLRSRGMTITSNAQPHAWPWQPGFAEGSPLRDVRIRCAINLGIDREGLRTLLGRMMAVPVGSAPHGHPWFGNPSSRIRHDKAAARRRMAEALFIWIAHPVSPRAMPPRVRGYVQAQSWLVDLRLPNIQ